MSKTIKQLQQEYAANEVKIQQEKHKLQRLNNRVQYYEKGDRQKRAHRLITRGAAIESVAPEVKELLETEFYTLAGYIFSLPEVKTAVSTAMTVRQRCTTAPPATLRSDKTISSAPTIAAIQGLAQRTLSGRLYWKKWCGCI